MNLCQNLNFSLTISSGKTWRTESSKSHLLFNEDMFKSQKFYLMSNQNMLFNLPGVEKKNLHLLIGSCCNFFFNFGGLWGE